MAISTDVKRSREKLAEEYDSALLRGLEVQLLNATENLQHASDALRDVWNQANDLPAGERDHVKKEIRYSEEHLDRAFAAIDQVRGTNIQIDMFLS
jgi:hypothetical protein